MPVFTLTRFCYSPVVVSGLMGRRRAVDDDARRRRWRLTAGQAHRAHTAARSGRHRCCWRGGCRRGCGTAGRCACVCSCLAGRPLQDCLHAAHLPHNCATHPAQRLTPQQLLSLLVSLYSATGVRCPPRCLERPNPCPKPRPNRALGNKHMTIACRCWPCPRADAKTPNPSRRRLHLLPTRRGSL